MYYRLLIPKVKLQRCRNWIWHSRQNDVLLTMSLFKDAKNWNVPMFTLKWSIGFAAMDASTHTNIVNIPNILPPNRTFFIGKQNQENNKQAVPLKMYFIRICLCTPSKRKAGPKWVVKYYGSGGKYGVRRL